MEREELVYHVQYSPPLVLTVSHMTLAYTMTYCQQSLSTNILPSTPRSRGLLPSSFLTGVVYALLTIPIRTTSPIHLKHNVTNKKQVWGWKPSVI
jgi:hypothetical protein